jgi:hypothetical protein
MSLHAIEEGSTELLSDRAHDYKREWSNLSVSSTSSSITDPVFGASLGSTSGAPAQAHAGPPARRAGLARSHRESSRVSVVARALGLENVAVSDDDAVESRKNALRLRRRSPVANQPGSSLGAEAAARMSLCETASAQRPAAELKSEVAEDGAARGGTTSFSWGDREESPTPRRHSRRVAEHRDDSRSGRGVSPGYPQPASG